MKFGIYIHVPLRTKCNNFPPYPSPGHFTLSSTLGHDQVPAKLMAFFPVSNIISV